MTRPTATSAARSSADPRSWKITHACPQCGAPVEMEETDRILSCPYCRVRLILSCPDVPRYVLPHKAAGDEEPVYVPYWRIRGSLYSSTPTDTGCEVRHRVLDQTHLAADWPEMPMTLGIRAQAMRLKIAAPTTPGRFCRATTDWSRALSATGEILRLDDPGAGGLKGDLFPDAFIGETLSLIYQPVFLRETLYDAVLNVPVGPLPSPERLRAPALEAKDRLVLRFIGTLCPECGWELEAERDALVLLCGRCSRAWELRNQKLERRTFGVVRADWRETDLLPFWRIRVDVAGIRLRTYADLVRFVNLPKVIRTAWEEQPLRLWIPAFKIQPAQFLRLARAVTVFQPQEMDGRVPIRPDRRSAPLDSSDRTGGPVSRSPAVAIQSVNLPAGEAAESLKVLLAEIGTPREKLISRLLETRITAVESDLAYLPFRLEGNELTNPDVPTALNRNLLFYGPGL